MGKYGSFNSDQRSSRSRSRSPRPDGDVDVACALSDPDLQRALCDEVSTRFVHCFICERAVEKSRSERLRTDDLNAACRQVRCPWPLCVGRACHAAARNRWIDFCLASEDEEASFWRGEKNEHSTNDLNVSRSRPSCPPQSKKAVSPKAENPARTKSHPEHPRT